MESLGIVDAGGRGGGQSRVEVEVEAELRRAGTRRGGGTVIGGQRC